MRGPTLRGLSHQAGRQGPTQHILAAVRPEPKRSACPGDRSSLPTRPSSTRSYRARVDGGLRQAQDARQADSRTQQALDLARGHRARLIVHSCTLVSVYPSLLRRSPSSDPLDAARLFKLGTSARPQTARKAPRVRGSASRRIAYVRLRRSVPRPASTAARLSRAAPLPELTSARQTRRRAPSRWATSRRCSASCSSS